MSKQSRYRNWYNKAVMKGWATPQNEVFTEEVWLNYWKQCEAYEENPENGRPVIPHRSGTF